MKRRIWVLLLLVAAAGMAWVWMAGGAGPVAVASVTFSEWRRNALGRIALFAVKNETNDVISIYGGGAVIRYSQWTEAGWETREVVAGSSGALLSGGIQPGSSGSYRIQLPFPPDAEVPPFKAGVRVFRRPSTLSRLGEWFSGQRAPLRESLHWSEVVRP